MDKDTITLNSFAKLNLILRVRGKRPDGYHLLEMVNSTIGLADLVELSLVNEPGITISLESEQPGIPLDETNLAVRAAQFFFEWSGKTRGVHIRIEKNIPVGAGLGGGSSNAAAVIRGLLELLYRPDSMEQLLSELQEPSQVLGADVPFFLSGGLAKVEGIGEVVTPLSNDALEGWPVYLVIPPFSNSTTEVYSMVGENFSPNGRPALSLEQLSPKSLFDQLENDLFPAALASNPKLSQFSERADALGSGRCLLTGSGSGLFFLPHDRESSQEAVEEELRQQFHSLNAVIIKSCLLAKHPQFCRL